MSKKISLRALQAFHAQMETGSTKAAAKRLGLSQPAISRMLATFEEYVGFELFHREHGRLIASNEAVVLYNEAEVTMGSLDRLIRLASNLKGTNIGSLKMVAPASFLAGPLADVVADFMKNHPNVQIHMDSRSPDSARELVAHRAFDCGFIQLPEHHAGLITTPLFKAALCCAIPNGHPLLEQTEVTADDLRDEPLIVLGKGRFSRSLIEQRFRESQSTMRIKIDTHTVATACAFVQRGLGIALVNEVLAQQFVGERMQLRPFAPEIAVEYGFITSKHAPMARVTEAFFTHCKNAKWG